MDGDAQTGRPEDVSIAQYAAVQVGVSLGAPLEQVLRNERLEPACWRSAERGWSARLSGTPDESLRSAFERALAEARTRYRRPWRPLDDSLEYWIAFSRHLDADANPLAMLANLGMGPGELLALRQLWQQRQSEDPSLAQRAQVLLTTEALGALPRVSPGPLEMAPPTGHDDSPRLGAIDDGAAAPPHDGGAETAAASAARPLAPKRVSKTAMGETQQEDELPLRPAKLDKAALAQTAYDGDLSALFAEARVASVHEGAEGKAPAAPRPGPADPDRGAISFGRPILRGDELPYPKRTSKTALGETFTDADAPEPQEYRFRSAPLSIRQYAAVRVQTDLEPASTATVLDAYGLTSASKQALDEELRAGCAGDPGIAKAWENAYGAYLDWWTKSRSGQG